MQHVTDLERLASRVVTLERLAAAQRSAYRAWLLTPADEFLLRDVGARG